MEGYTARQRRYCLPVPHQRCAVYDNIFNLRATRSVEMVVGNRLKGCLKNLSNTCSPNQRAGAGYEMGCPLPSLAQPHRKEN